MKYTSRITKRGQITIPKQLRERLNLNPGDLVIFEVRDKEIVIRKAELKVL